MQTTYEELALTYFYAEAAYATADAAVEAAYEAGDHDNEGLHAKRSAALVAVEEAYEALYEERYRLISWGKGLTKRYPYLAPLFRSGEYHDALARKLAKLEALAA